MKREELVLVGVVAALLVLVAFFWLRSLARTIADSWVRYRAIINTPRTPMGSLRPGFREVRGRVVRPEEPIISPMTSTPCVFYSFVVKEKVTTTVRRNGKNRSHTEWVTVVHDAKALGGAEVRDSSGRALVDLMTAELHLAPDTRARSGFLNSAPQELQQLLRERYKRETQGLLFSKAMTWSETVVEPDDELFIIGDCEKGRNGWEFNGRTGLFVVGDQPESVIARTYLWRVVGNSVLASLVAIGVVVLPAFFAKAIR